MQWFYGDPNAGNAMAVLATAGRLVQIGPVRCENRYVWELFDETAARGTLQAGGPVVRLVTVP